MRASSRGILARSAVAVLAAAIPAVGPTGPGTQAGAPPQAAVSVTGYRTTPGLVVAHLRRGYRPYDDMPVVALSGTTAASSSATRTSSARVTHPVRLAQGSFMLSNSYRKTGVQEYLDRAVTAANKLISIRVVVDDAWYFPYDFDFAVHGDTTQTLRAPWYSGMAQGYALTAFVRLHELTGDPRWRVAADATFASLDRPPTGGGRPFVTWVDSAQNLWLEEYPRPGVTDSERVLNGHVFAAYGLYDYWQLTGSTRALHLLNGALTTVERLAPAGFRRPGAASVYSLRHARPTVTYHPVHTGQLRYLFQLTHRSRFASYAMAYRTDFPYRMTAGTAVVRAGSRTAYRLDSARRVTATRTVRFTAQTSVRTDRRERVTRGPVALRVSSGPLAGWWLREGFGQVWLLRPQELHRYAPHVLTLALAPGTYTAYRYDSAGRRVGARVLSLPSGARMPATTTAVVEARTAAYLASGPLAGHWLPMRSGIVLR